MVHRNHVARQAVLKRNSHAGQPGGQADRRGSTLLIVVALLGLLSLLGFVFYTFAAQERANAEFFSDAAKKPTEPDLDYFDFALKQVIVGPNRSQVNSALWGSRHALVTTMFGDDVHPFTGEGVHLITGPNGGPGVDQNRDGSADGGTPEDHYLLRFNDSPAAQNGFDRKLTDRSLFPSPDVDYTYPDINNIAVSYDGYALSANGTPYRCIIPSYHRPQYLRDGSGNPIQDWNTNSNTDNKIMRPHPNHVYCVMSPRGNVSSTGVYRFIQSGDSLIGPGVGQVGSAFPFTTAPQSGLWTDTSGTAAVPTSTTYAFDYDNDGDGTKEGVLLDLDHPIQQRSADSKLYIPLYSVTVKEVDGLFNLNIHGDIPRLASLSLSSTGGTAFGGDSFLPTSNQGLGPNEVNPLWGLNWRPNTADDMNPPPMNWNSNPEMSLSDNWKQFYYFFGDLPYPHGTVTVPGPPSGPGAAWREAANMEWWFLLMGRGEMTGGGAFSDLYAGRWGELNRLYNALSGGAATAFPRPGRAGVDDNGNQDEGVATLYTGPYVHPLDLDGGGSYRTSAKQVDLLQPGSSNPSAWVRYSDYGLAGGVDWNLEIGGLLTGSQTGVLVDDPLEVTVEPKRADPPYDEIYGPEELAFLHLPEADSTAVSSRLKDLVPFNFSETYNSRARDIRKKFTTLSWDRKNFNLSPSGMRDWELTAVDLNGDMRTDGYRFPPDFAGAAAYTDESRSQHNSAYPLRSALVELIEVFDGSRSLSRKQFRLNLNQYLTADNNQLGYRELTPHPTTDATVATLPTTAPSYPPTTAAAQEYYARIDRQRMARDIYMLLYLLGGGSNSDYTDSSTVGYTALQLREMAQFAVNVVDALDRDDVITHFEYDTNPTNGWDLDDLAWTTGESDRAEVFGVEEQSLTFSEALWLKTNQLDATALATAGTDGGASPGHRATMYDDTTGEHHFLFVELRNASAFGVPLADTTQSTTADKGLWRIRRAESSAGQNETVVFQSGAPTIAAGGQRVVATTDVNATMGNSKRRPAEFRVNYDTFNMPATDDTYELIAPNTGIGSNPAKMNDNLAPKSSVIDLMYDDHETWFELGDSGGPGEFLNATNAPAAGVTPLVLVLERRLNTNLPNLDVSDANPWVEVDRIEVAAETFNLVESDNVSPTNTIQPKVAARKSHERPQPFTFTAGASNSNIDGMLPYTSGSAQNSVPSGGWSNFDGGVRNNSLGYTINRKSPSKFTQWQVHYNRDFASPMELLSVPLYGPSRTAAADTNVVQFGGPTRWQELAQRAPRQQYEAAENAGRTDGSLDNRPRPLSAEAMFLQPIHPDNLEQRANTNGSPSIDRRKDNRWYRLFEFVEVTQRTHRQLGDTFSTARVPGKINLNMVRHPSVLAGLLDDTDVINLDMSSPFTPSSPGLTDQTGVGENRTFPPNPENTNERNWWREFIRSRDRGIDNISSSSYAGDTRQWGLDPTTGLFLPGLPSARPFRSFAYLPQQNWDKTTGLDLEDPIEHTLLRRLPKDIAADDWSPSGTLTPDERDNRQLFEVASQAEHDFSNPPGSSRVESPVRHRLLSKIANNVTTRSNVFVVYITVDFYEVAEVTSGAGVTAYRIGGKLPPLAGGVVEPKPQRGVFVIDRSNAEEAYDSGSGTFNWRELIKDSQKDLDVN